MPGRLKIALGRDTHGQPVVTDLAKLPHMLVAGSTGSGKSVFLNSMVIGFLLQFTPDDMRMLAESGAIVVHNPVSNWQRRATAR